MSNLLGDGFNDFPILIKTRKDIVLTRFYFSLLEWDYLGKNISIFSKIRMLNLLIVSNKVSFLIQ